MDWNMDWTVDWNWTMDWTTKNKITLFYFKPASITSMGRGRLALFRNVTSVLV